MLCYLHVLLRPFDRSTDIQFKHTASSHIYLKWDGWRYFALIRSVPRARFRACTVVERANSDFEKEFWALYTTLSAVGLPIQKKEGQARLPNSEH